MDDCRECDCCEESDKGKVKTQLECISCAVKQTLLAARMATDDELKQRQILHRVMELLIHLSEEISPVELSQRAHRLIRDISGNPDPYFDIKRQTNENALSLFPEMQKMVENAEDPLETAMRLSVAGNVIDLGLGESEFDVEGEIQAVLSAPFRFYHYPRFKKDVTSADSILYFLDNAGEIVFDRLLIEMLKKVSRAEIVSVVRGSPILNDATMEDARFVGLTEVIEVIDSGNDAPGTILSQMPAKIINLFEKSDVIISKGQGNYETLSESKRNVYFLFKIKCPVVAEYMNAKVGEYVLKG